MKTINFALLSILCAVICVACTNPSNKTDDKGEIISDGIQADQKADQYKIISTDTITHELLIKNPNPDDVWKDECLKHFDREAYIAYIKEGVKSGQLTLCSELTGNPLTKEEIATLENAPDFSYDRLAMMQFSERWEWNLSQQTFEKKVHSIAFGYEVYDEQGAIRGYKPAFKLFFKSSTGK